MFYVFSYCLFQLISFVAIKDEGEAFFEHSKDVESNGMIPHFGEHEFGIEDLNFEGILVLFQIGFQPGF